MIGSILLLVLLMLLVGIAAPGEAEERSGDPIVSARHHGRAKPGYYRLDWPGLTEPWGQVHPSPFTPTVPC